MELAVLHLLRSAGYQPVLNSVGDGTLEKVGNNLFVFGRGERHQIDAIGDYLFQAPFSYPQRLLVEAKFYDKRNVGLTVIRNAMGVVSDVSQFFVPTSPGNPQKRRYHYQYAVASATDFSSEAQHYAYAHDICLLPLGNSAFARPLMDTIRKAAARLEATAALLGVDFNPMLREAIRRHLWAMGLDNRFFDEQFVDADGSMLEQYYGSVASTSFGLIAMTSSGFAIFLVPAPSLGIIELPDRIDVRILREDDGSWVIDATQWRPASGNRQLFSFDLPETLVALYRVDGTLPQEQALAMKAEHLRQLSVVVVVGERIKVLRLDLDMPWVEALHRRGHVG